MVSRSCWDIMKCSDSENCMARQNPYKMCWEHSRDIGALQNYYSVCPDCIVYVANRKGSVLSEFEINEILNNNRFAAKRNHGQCQLSNYIDMQMGYDERREARRYSCNGHTQAVISNHLYRDLSCRLLNISETGLAFTSKEGVSANNSILTMNVKLGGMVLKNIPLSIVSDMPFKPADDEIRYGGKFKNLSYQQESMLSDILNHCEL